MPTSRRAQATAASLAVLCAFCIRDAPEAHAGPTATKATWTRLVDGPDVSDPTGRMNAAMTFDSDRGVVVLFGGSYDSFLFLNDTWEWTDDVWTCVGQGGAAPPPRVGAAIAYDALRGETVLFGGWGVHGVLDDTWVWDGETWTERNPSVRPPARTNSSAAFVAGKMVIFGGSGASFEPLGDTWEWDSDEWVQRAPLAAPAARFFHELAYDAKRGEAILFGGADGNEVIDVFGDTWAWNGDDWSLRSNDGPTPRVGFAMSYDEVHKVVVLFGGKLSVNDYSFFVGTWEWNGSGWSPVAAGSLPGSTPNPSMAYAGAGVSVLVAGNILARVPFGTHLWDGTSWLKGACQAGGPPSVGAQLAWDPRRDVVVLFGGMDACGRLSSETWEWSRASGWRDVSSATSPAARVGHTLAFDPISEGVLLFGGSNGNLFGVPIPMLRDTWLWDGTDWTELVTTNPPLPRELAAMATNGGDSVILAGGFSSVENAFIMDLWEWDGVEWSEVGSIPAPLARMEHALVSGPNGGVIVVGGFNGYSVSATPVVYGDTWLWRDAQWDLLSPSSIPGLRSFGLALDASRSVPVLFGGYSVLGPESTTYELVGSTWQSVDPPASPPPLGKAAMATAPGGRGVLLHGGFGPPTRYGDTWLYAEGGAPGVPCAEASDCVLGFCTDGVCCDMAACAACQLCDASGTCATTAPNGTPCEDGDDCTADDVCSVGTCISGPDVCDESGCGCRVMGSARGEEELDVSANALLLLIAGLACASWTARRRYRWLLARQRRIASER